MCGVVGCIGDKTKEFLQASLPRLANRGYDSSGIVLSDGQKIYRRRTKGIIKGNLIKNGNDNFKPTIGLAHTRWATSSTINVTNTHPIRWGNTYVVHNGIVEPKVNDSWPSNVNIKGRVFDGKPLQTETDTEWIACLLEHSANLEHNSQFKFVMESLEGDYSFVAIDKKEPDVLVFARKGRPLWVVNNKGNFFISSEISSFSGFAEEAWEIPDNCYGVECSGFWFEVRSLDGTKYEGINSLPNKVKVPTIESYQDDKHMLREIQAQVKLSLDSPKVPFGIPKPNLLHLFGCGSSWNASLLGQIIIEKIAKVPVEVDYSTVLENRLPELLEIFPNRTYVALTQSGETADTVKVIDKIISPGKKFTRGNIYTITNNPHSQAALKSNQVFELGVGPEYGVAATKTFTGQVLTCLKLAIQWNAPQESHFLRQTYDTFIKNFQDKVIRLCEAKQIRELAKEISSYKNALFLAEGPLYPIAMEGALKLKEVSYIHAEGMPSHNIKHGVLPLCKNAISIFLLDQYTNYKQVLNNIEQVHVRNGKILTICTDNSSKGLEKYGKVLIVNSVGNMYINALAINVACQLLAHYTAETKGFDSSRPRTLAKAITV